MNDPHRPASVAVLAFADASASVVWGYAKCAAPDIVCVPDINVPPGHPLDDRTEDIAALRRWYASGATIASACSGAMLLAEAGLLDGEEATTHWAYCDVMRKRHPAVKVRLQRALRSRLGGAERRA